MAFIGGLYRVAVYDFAALIFIGYISIKSNLSISLRKSLFIGFQYLTSILLLFYLGSIGPGLLYLFGNTIFIILIFPKRNAYSSVVINALICISMGIVIKFDLTDNPVIFESSISSWIAVSSNLIILTIVIITLLPMLFNGLQNNVEEQYQLKNQLKLEQESLKSTMVILKHKNIELEQFAYIASHDLQEPLRMITSFLTLLEKRYDGKLDEKARQYIHFAVDGASRMRQIIMDLLEYSKAGNSEFNDERIDLDKLLNEIVQLNNQYIKEKGAIIKWGNLPVINAKKTPLFQVFQNLINNAIKYQKPGSSPIVKIEAKSTAEQWIFSVSDNGIGIDPINFTKIFIVFQRLHSKEDYPGTGIGLAICNKIIENLGGKIWLESQPGVGSTFYFTIPKLD